MAITYTEESKADLPICLSVGGSSKRRKLIFLRLTSGTGGEEYDVSGTVEPNSADIEGILYHTIDGVAATLPTWSTNVITLGSAGVVEMGVIVNLT